MPIFASTALTCFAVIAVPNLDRTGSALLTQPVILSGYHTLEAATEARDILGRPSAIDTSDRLKDEAYHQTDAYKQEQLRIAQRAKQEQDRKKKWIKDNPGKPEYEYYSSVLNPGYAIDTTTTIVATTAYLRLWNSAVVIPAPEKDCK